MTINQLPIYERSDNPTGCCPRFKPEGWDRQQLHFKNKLFVKVSTRNLMHIPINMGKVFKKTFQAIEKAGAIEADQFVVLTRDVSPWKSTHYFAVSREVPGQENVRLSGDFITRVFEGSYDNVPDWYSQLQDELKEEGQELKDIFFFYTTCPKCAKTYGKNYVVAFGKVA